MPAPDLASAIAVQDALRTIDAARDTISVAISNARPACTAGSDMADAVECLRSWLSDGKATMEDALKIADREVRGASEAEYERRVVPHPIAAE